MACKVCEKIWKELTMAGFPRLPLYMIWIWLRSSVHEVPCHEILVWSIDLTEHLFGIDSIQLMIQSGLKNESIQAVMKNKIRFDSIHTSSENHLILILFTIQIRIVYNSAVEIHRCLLVAAFGTKQYYRSNPNPPLRGSSRHKRRWPMITPQVTSSTFEVPLKFLWSSSDYCSWNTLSEQVYSSTLGRFRSL